MFENLGVELAGGALTLSLLVLGGWAIWRWNSRQLDRVLSEIASLS